MHSEYACWRGAHAQVLRTIESDNGLDDYYFFPHELWGLALSYSREFTTHFQLQSVFFDILTKHTSAVHVSLPVVEDCLAAQTSPPLHR